MLEDTGYIKLPGTLINLRVNKDNYDDDDDDDEVLSTLLLSVVLTRE